MIGQSQSGTGKTAAFVLNMLARTDLAMPATQALVLAPSRELARQILGVVTTMGQFMPNLSVAQAIPDQSQRGKKVEGHIVVGTPGTVTDIIRRRLLDPSRIKVLVLDEADNMLDQQGLGDQCTRVKSYVAPPRTKILQSLTLETTDSSHTPSNTPSSPPHFPTTSPDTLNASLQTPTNSL